MNVLLIRKKHSKRIAVLALHLGIIDKDFYKSLYIESYNRHHKSRYYEELFFTEGPDCFGEYDETSLISHIESVLFYATNTFDPESGDFVKPVSYFNTTLKIIDFLNKMKKDKRGNDFYRFTN